MQILAYETLKRGPPNVKILRSAVLQLLSTLDT